MTRKDPGRVSTHRKAAYRCEQLHGVGLVEHRFNRAERAHVRRSEALGDGSNPEVEGFGYAPPVLYTGSPERAVASQGRGGLYGSDIEAAEAAVAAVAAVVQAIGPLPDPTSIARRPPL